VPGSRLGSIVTDQNGKFKFAYEDALVPKNEKQGLSPGLAKICKSEVAELYSHFQLGTEQAGEISNKILQ